MRENIKQLLSNQKQRGAVSLFVVIFSAFLFVAVTVGFTVLMVSDQNRATDNDLAQSARDSAEAGIEEAKRVLAQLEACGQGAGRESAAAGNDCNRIANAVNSGECGTIRAAQGLPADEETIISKDITDEQLEQAFTCVKINQDTLTYEGRLDGEGDVRVVPIRGVGDIASVKVSWVRSDTSSGGRISPSHDSRGVNGSTIWSQSPPIMPSKGAWNSYGSILRVGSFQYPAGGEISISGADESSRTAFLYPTTSGAGGVTSFDMNQVDKHSPPPEAGRLSIVDDPNVPVNIRCGGSGSGDGSFLCSATFNLAQPVSSNVRSFLTLSSIYNSTEFRVELTGPDGNPVRFQNVQPEIDSTGRANNVFRRLVARVESADAVRAPYPRAALGSSNSVCKAYLITDSAEEFIDYGVQSGDCPDVTNPLNP